MEERDKTLLKVWNRDHLSDLKTYLLCSA